MPIKPEFLAIMSQFEEAHNRALDWLILSWKKKGEDKGVVLAFYRKYKRISFELVSKLCNITHEPNKNE